MAKFFIFFLTLFLVTLCAAAVCFAASATVRVFALANLLAVCVFIFMMVGLHDIFHLFCQLDFETLYCIVAGTGTINYTPLLDRDA